MGVNGEGSLAAAYKAIFLKVTKEFISVVQNHMKTYSYRINTTSHLRIHIMQGYIKSSPD